MNSQKKTFVTFLVVIICIVGIISAKSFISSQGTGISDNKELTRFKGNPDAPIQIIEFIDFQCPACAYGAKEINKMMKENPDFIRLELKYFPLRMHKHAVLSAKYAECAGEQGQFWPMHDLLVNQQERWYKLNDARPAFELMVDELELKRSKFEKCLNRPAIVELIMASTEEGKKLGVKSTPTYFINGKLIVGPNNLKTEIDSFNKEEDVSAEK